MFQGLWPKHFNDKSFTLQDEGGIVHNLVLSVTDLNLNTLKQEMTQQPTDATYVMVHKMDNSSELHTVYIKALHNVYTRPTQGNRGSRFVAAEIINSVPSISPFIRLNMPDNKFFKIKCVFI